MKETKISETSFSDLEVLGGIERVVREVWLLGDYGTVFGVSDCNKLFTSAGDSDRGRVVRVGEHYLKLIWNLKLIWKINYSKKYIVGTERLLTLLVYILKEEF